MDGGRARPGGGLPSTPMLPPPPPPPPVVVVVLLAAVGEVAKLGETGASAEKSYMESVAAKPRLTSNSSPPASLAPSALVASDGILVASEGASAVLGSGRLPLPPWRPLAGPDV